MENTDKLDLSSPDLVSQNIDKIATLFPNCVTETAEGKAIDFDLLKQELNHEVVEGAKERYRLEWPGKKEAIVTANLPTTKTLRPVREDSVDFDTTENMYIEGDNLEVLKILQESYLGKIKMIYIDPPYNTGKDFVYKDNFTQDSAEFKEETDQIDEYGNRLVANPETAGRYHSDWLSMMYPRLKLARNLLTDDGVILISIGDDELDNLKKISDEIFGMDNFILNFSRAMKSGGAKGKFYTPCIDYILVYAKSINEANNFRKPLTEEQIKRFYNKYDTEGSRKGELYGEERLYKASLDPRPNQRYYIKCPDGSFVIPPGVNFPQKVEEGEKIIPTSEDGVWKWIYSRYKDEYDSGNIIFKNTKTSALVDSFGKKSCWNIYNKLWLKEQQEKGSVPSNLITDFENRQSSKELKDLSIPFDFAKPSTLIKYLIGLIGMKNKDIILDFFSGSASTAQAILQQNAEDGGNRKYIMVQLPEATNEKSEAYKAGYKNICEIGKERIRRAAAKIKEELAQSGVEGTNAEIDYGFKVFKVDSSNMQEVYYKPQDYNQGQLDVFADNIKEDRTSEDLLTQILLDWGLPLTLKTQKETVLGKEVFVVDTNYLLACFDTELDEAFAKEIAKHQPLRFVCKDSSFKNDTAKENVKQLLKQLSPNTEMKVI